MLWVDKHSPKKLSEISGNSQAVRALSDWLSSWKKGGKAALLFGPPGVGKTTAAHLLAKERDLEIIETNASNYRNKKEIQKVVGSASSQASLFSGNSGKLILVDEVDGVSGRKDFGGISALASLIKESNYPIIMTANKAIVSGVGGGGPSQPFDPAKWERKFVGKADNRFRVFHFLKEVYFSETGEKPNDKAIWATVFSTEKKAGGEIREYLKALPLGRGANWWEWNPKISALKSLSVPIEFRNPPVGEISLVLERVAKEEGLSLGEGVSSEIAAKTGCDARAAITMLEACGRGRKELALEDLKSATSGRERKALLEDSVRIILATGNAALSRDAYRATESTPEELSGYLSENISRFYSREDMANAYRALSDADIVSGRIISTGSQSLLPYRIEFMTGGVSVSKKGGRMPIAGKITNPLSKYNPSIVKKRRLRKQVHSKIRKVLPLAKPSSVVRLALADNSVREALSFDSEEEEFLDSLEGKRKGKGGKKA